MATASLTTKRFALRRDPAAVRKTLKRVRASDRLAPLKLFGRRRAAQMLEYLDRRTTDRRAVEIPIWVLPVSFDGTYASLHDEGNDAIMAITKDVSLRGIGFTHDEPLQSDYAVVYVELTYEETISMVLEIRWSNVNRDHDCYMSGGMFLGVTTADIRRTAPDRHARNHPHQRGSGTDEAGVLVGPCSPN